MERENLKSRLGFILISAGCAIGVGNVWKFPYMVGNNGGGIFVLIYVIFLIMLGLPILIMEFAMGRASKKSIVCVYDELVPEKKVWRIHSYMGVLGNYMLMFFYTSVAGWMMNYCFKYVSGEMAAMTSLRRGIRRYAFRSVTGCFLDACCNNFGHNNMLHGASKRR